MFHRLDNPLGIEHISVIEFGGVLCWIDDVDWLLYLLATVDGGMITSEVDYFVCKVEFLWLNMFSFIWTSTDTLYFVIEVFYLW